MWHVDGHRLKFCPGSVGSLPAFFDLHSPFSNKREIGAVFVSLGVYVLQLILFANIHPKFFGQITEY